LLLSVTGVLRMSGCCAFQAHDSAATEELGLTLPDDVPTLNAPFSPERLLKVVDELFATAKA